MALIDRGAIEKSAVATLLYFDIFDHPLTVEETFAFLPTNSITVGDLREAIENSRAIDRHAHVVPELLLLRGRPVEWLAQRMEKKRYAQTLWRRAQTAARFIACFPFVRGLFVSGSLSKDAPDARADVDWFIVTEPGRLWVCKTILTLFRRVVLLNSTKYFCTNYYVSADNLEIPDRNVFIATEIATARPVVGTELAGRFFSENAWIREYFPNVQPPDTAHVVRPRLAPFLRRMTEWMFAGAVGDALNRVFLSWHLRYEQRKHADLSREEFQMMFRAGLTECKIHHKNFQGKVIEAYERRLREYGVTRKTKEV